jgi:DNA-binding XRE family transcriptional regulator
MTVNSKYLNMLIAERIIKLREYEIDGKPRVQKITQKAIAQSLDVPRTTIANIENHRQAAPLALLYNIASVFNAELFDLLPSSSELNKELEVKELLIGGKNVKAEIGEELTAIVKKTFRG